VHYSLSLSLFHFKELNADMKLRNYFVTLGANLKSLMGKICAFDLLVSANLPLNPPAKYSSVRAEHWRHFSNTLFGSVCPSIPTGREHFETPRIYPTQEPLYRSLCDCTEIWRGKDMRI
jgi:hypothetical protein